MKALVTIEGRTASVQSIPVPTPGEGEILVKVHYVAQNPTDWKGVSATWTFRLLYYNYLDIKKKTNTS